MNNLVVTAGVVVDRGDTCHAFTIPVYGITLDGFSAGPDQSINDPLGVNGKDMMEWFFPTKTFIEQDGGEGGDDREKSHAVQSRGTRNRYTATGSRRPAAPRDARRATSR